MMGNNIKMVCAVLRSSASRWGQERAFVNMMMNVPTLYEVWP